MSTDMYLKILVEEFRKFNDNFSEYRKTVDSLHDLFAETVEEYDPNDLAPEEDEVEYE